jgi:hypothetical protein
MTVTAVLRNTWQEDLEFEASLCYTPRSCHKTKKEVRAGDGDACLWSQHSGG